MASTAVQNRSHRDRGERVVCADPPVAATVGSGREPASANTLRVSVTSLVFLLVAVDAVCFWFRVVPFWCLCLKDLACLVVRLGKVPGVVA